MLGAIILDDPLKTEILRCAKQQAEGSSRSETLTMSNMKKEIACIDRKIGRIFN